MPFPLLAIGSLLLEAANVVPALAKFAGAGEKAQGVVERVAQIASDVGGLIDPKEALKKIREDEALSQEFRLRIMDKMHELDEMYLKDIQDARSRDVDLAKAGFRNNRANWLTLIAVLSVAGIVIITIWASDLDEYVKGIITLVLGRMLGYMDQIYNFEFGTTRQSRAKDETIASLSKPKDPE